MPDVQRNGCRFVPPVEVRQYDPFLVAEVTFGKDEAQDMKSALSGGFRAIAGYIFDSKVRPLACNMPVCSTSYVRYGQNAGSSGHDCTFSVVAASLQWLAGFVS